ncbi:sugar ABC transporter ATP-binding protein [Massilia sp. PWRC2]|uniref:sugar ABC transporter ATP-binding protein n=1 Tax=Massilia sp. PWRC2 TaxID=2804626 RepID=UPI003CF6B970
MVQPHQAAPVLALAGIDKQFPGVQALSGAGLNLYAGEVHTLMGQNGAGKSTLIKVLTGLSPPERGSMLLDGVPIAPRSPQAAQALGISTVYQEVNLCPNLSVAENLFIGRYPRRFGMLDWGAMRRHARIVLAQLRLDIDVSAPLARLPLALQQLVAIGRALATSARVLILDEPTSSLDEAEVQLLFGVLRRLRDQGMAILFVTHFLEQTYAISDRITVMRNGEREGEYRVRDLTRLALVNKMVGTVAAPLTPALPGFAPAAGSDAAPILLRARGLTKKGMLAPLDIDIRRGEMLGLCGLLGSGRTETARLLFGADRADGGSIDIHGRAQPFAAPREAIAHGIGFCSEDRKREGAILELSVRDNLMLALQAKRGMLRPIPLRRQQALAREYVERLGIKTASIDTPIGTLSGGNQQKALLARALATAPALLILDEPTRGIDVQAKLEIMAFVCRLCGDGMAVLFISSELPEVLRWSDRMIVLRDRQARGSYVRGELDESSVLHAIAAQPA